MIGHLRILPHRLLLSASLFLLLASAALAESGHLLIIKDPSGGPGTVRKVQKLERKGGFYLSQTFSGKTERFDAMSVGQTIDLSSFEPQRFDGQEDISAAKGAELRALDAIKKYPVLANDLAAPLAQLRKEIGRAENGEKKLAGTWLTKEQVAALNAPKHSTINRGSLRLKNGTTYDNVDIVSANPQELRITHTNGAATIPLALVPEEFMKKNNLTPTEATSGKPKK
jgi:hypothetical protein